MTDGTTLLRGRRALVTGAALRLGRAIALGLAREGVDVVVHYRASAGPAEETRRELASLGVRAWTVQADLAAPAQAEALLPAASALAGPIDILVNSASIFPADRITTFAPADLHRSVDVNALAPLLLSRALAAQGGEGAIVNLLDSRVVDYDEHHAAYHLSKRLLLAVTRLTALEFAPRIRVNAVAPGLILPPPGEDDSFLARMAHTNPLDRHGQPEEVAAAVLFLLRSPFVTGQVIFVDGGRHLKGDVHG